NLSRTSTISVGHGGVAGALAAPAGLVDLASRAPAGRGERSLRMPISGCASGPFTRLPDQRRGPSPGQTGSPTTHVPGTPSPVTPANAPAWGLGSITRAGAPSRHAAALASLGHGADASPRPSSSSHTACLRARSLSTAPP